MKILITSDNHLGYNETDPIRSEDSFNTFEEILNIAKIEKVDYIFQGGDLFHYNTPSRNTYNKIFKLLKKYSIGDKTNLNTIFSDDYVINSNFLSIHGNHDDPSGFNSVSPMDILNSSKLVTYFGKCSNMEKIEIKPILIKKNGIKIALYGLGHIKDRRLYKAFEQKKVFFIKPDENYYSILMVHQNRVFRDKEYLAEEFIPSFFDLVIYGHEHLSVKLTCKNFELIQVGSSVRTSLCPDESFNKFLYILEFNNLEPKITRKKLNTVRNLYMENLKIFDLDIEKHLKNQIENFLFKIKQENNLLPLYRLKVEINNLRSYNKHFINSLVEGKIANPNDFLKIVRKTEIKKTIDKIDQPKTFNLIDIYSETLNTVNFEVFNLEKSIESLNDYLEKNNKNAFSEMVFKNMENILKNINIENLGAENIDEIIKNSLIKKNNVSEIFKKLKSE